MKNPLGYELSKIGYRGYTIQFNATHIVVRSPEGYLRYELGRNDNTTQDAMETIDKDIEITNSFRRGN